MELVLDFCVMQWDILYLGQCHTECSVRVCSHARWRDDVLRWALPPLLPLAIPPTSPDCPSISGNDERDLVNFSIESDKSIYPSRGWFQKRWLEKLRAHFEKSTNFSCDHMLVELLFILLGFLTITQLNRHLERF